jgi:hypothetical protein
MDNEFREIIKDFANRIYIQLAPEIEKAMVQKIIDVALEMQYFRWVDDNKIKSEINEATDGLLKSRYKDIVNYMADEKVKKKLRKKAEEQGFNIETDPQLSFLR